jgi:hypothetical protein
LFSQREGDMTIGSRWLISVGVVGATAAVLAGALVWLMLTDPLATAQALGRAF